MADRSSHAPIWLFAGESQMLMQISVPSAARMLPAGEGAM
jgi:hypothetical protein